MDRSEEKPFAAIPQFPYTDFPRFLLLLPTIHPHMSSRYDVKGKIGQGGLGDVYLAHDSQLGRDVALKRVRPPEDNQQSHEALEADLLREARTLSALQHPNIVTIYDVGSDEQGSFVVMELLKGETLDQVAERGKLSVEDFREVVVQVLEGMVAAQSLGLVHRDLKPGNLMVNWLASGKFQIKILDFGLARFSRTAVPQTQDQEDGIFGSIWFMAPEQFERLPLDGRTDLYSLGCIFYEILSQRHPFDGRTPVDVMVSHLNHTVEPLGVLRSDVPPWMASWVMWLIARSMDDRPANARTALEFFMAERSGLAAVPPPIPEIAPAAAAASQARPSVQHRPVRVVGRAPTRSVNPAAPAPVSATAPTRPMNPAVSSPTAPVAPSSPAAQGSRGKTAKASKSAAKAKGGKASAGDMKKWWIAGGVGLAAFFAYQLFKPMGQSLARAEPLELIRRLTSQNEPKGDAALIAQLTEWVGKEGSPETPEIVALLPRLKGEGLGEAIALQLETAKGTAREVLIDAVADHPSAAGAAVLLGIITEESGDVRMRALAAMAPAASADDATAIVKAAGKFGDDASRRKLAATVNAILAKLPDAAARVTRMASWLSSCDPAFRPEILRLLAASGDPSANAALAAEINAGGDRMRDAFAVLDAWPSPDAGLADAATAAARSGDAGLVGSCARLIARLPGLDAAEAAGKLRSILPMATPGAAQDEFCAATGTLAGPEATALLDGMTSDAANAAREQLSENAKKITEVREGDTVLPAAAAVILSNGKDAFHSPTVRYLTGWTKPTTRIAWDVTVAKPGRVALSILQSSAEKGDHSYRISLGETSAERNVRMTGSNEQFEKVEAGTFAVPRAGQWRVWLEAVRMTEGRPLMNVRDVTVTVTP